MLSQLLSRVQLFLTLWTVAYQAPLSMGFSRQECWSELLFPSPGHLPDSGIEPTSPVSPALQADSLPTELPGKLFSWSSRVHCMLLLSRFSRVRLCNPIDGSQPGSPIPGMGRSPGGGNGNPLQFSCLENPMDRRAWRATVHGVIKESGTTEAT